MDQQGWKKFFDWPIFNTTKNNEKQVDNTSPPPLPQQQQGMITPASSLIGSSSSTISTSSANTDATLTSIIEQQLVKNSSKLSINSTHEKSLRKPLKRKEHNNLKKKVNNQPIGLYVKKKPKQHSINSTKSEQQVESLSIRNVKASLDLKWNEHPDAWGYLYSSSNSANYPSQYLKHRQYSNERKGYLIGSDSSCDIKISDDRIQSRHCLVYAENFTNLNNESSIRVFLKDLSDIECPTLISINKVIVEKKSKEPVCLQSLDSIKFISPNSDSNICKYRILFAPNLIAETFQDEYTLCHILGRGAFSDVHVAKLKNSKSENPEFHIVKVIYKDRFKHQRKALQHFAQEISILMSLEKHPGIVGIVKVYDEIKNFQIVMDYIPEGDLFDFIVNCGRLTEESTRTIFNQLFTTVKFLHNAGIVHRDLKPENILMASKAELRVKICDFGLATLHQNSYYLTSQCGTDNYVAPEILNLNDSKIRSLLSPLPPGEPTMAYGKECDLWSLGVILYICLCGKPPFYDHDYGKISKKQCILIGQYDFSDAAWNNVSQAAKDLINRLLTVDPTERITIDEALAHLWMTNIKE